MRSLSRYDLPPGTQLGGRTSQNACITVSACPPYHQAAFWVHDGRPSVVPSSCQRSLSAEQAELRRRAAGISDSGSTLLVAKSCASSACRRASAVPSPFDSFAPAGLCRSCSRPHPASPTGVASRAGLEFRLGECSSCYSQAERPKRASERLSSLPHGRFFRSRRPTLTQGQVYSQRGSVTSPPHGG